MWSAMLILATLGADDKAADEAIAKFKKDMANPSGAARVAAVMDLSRVPHEKTFKALAPLLTNEVTVVRSAAAKGLGGFGDYRKLAVPALLGALAAGPNAKEPEVQAAILEGLGKLHDDSTLGTIHRYFEDKDVRVAKAALGAAAEIKRIQSIDVIIELMKKLEKFTEEQNNGGGGYGTPGLGIPGGGDDPNRTRARDVLPECIKTLKVITKENWPTSKEWVMWWSKKKSTFKIE